MNRMLAILIVSLMTILNGCKDFTEKTRAPGETIKYFTWWASYELPIRPVDEISKKEAESRESSYYIAKYGPSGKLMSFEKHLNGNIIRKIKYFYNPQDIIIKCETTDPSEPDSGIMEQYFNLSGTYVKRRELDSKGHLLKEEIIAADQKSVK